MKKLLVLVLALALSLGLTSVAFAAYDNPYGTDPTTIAPAPGQPMTPSPLVDGDTADNGIGNANASGGDVLNNQIQDQTSTMADMDNQDIIKSKDMRMTDLAGGTGNNQRTHGAYQNNTNSCASCHQTHTGASKDLLIKRGVYNTCTACHDGTLGFYNVFSASTAGTFAGTEGGNASVHLANNTLFVNMAPGFSNAAGVSNQIANDNFDCASCHAPHGSYSSRLLHYSPNGMADVDITKKGNKLVDYTVEAAPAALPAAAVVGDPAFKVVRGPADVAGIAGEGTSTVIYVIKKQPKTGGGYEYVRDTNPWVAGYEHAMMDDYTVLKMANYTEFFNGATKITGFDADGEMNGTLIPIYGLAYAKGTGIGTITKANIARAYVVTLAQQPADPAHPTFGNIPITKVITDSYDEPGTGIAISLYCGACHTDYMTHSKDGDGDGIFRHSTDTDRFNCLKCHFAHGTDVTVMKDARDRDLAFLAPAGETDPNYTTAKEYLLDKNPSSALKRYTNMAVCWKCHSAVEGKSSKLMNNTEYWTDYATNPRGGNNPAQGTYEPNWLKNNWEN